MTRPTRPTRELPAISWRCSAFEWLIQSLFSVFRLAGKALHLLAFAKISKMALSVASKMGRGSVQFCRRYETVESGIWDDGIRFLTSHHRLQRRAYAFFSSNGPGKPRISKFAHFTYSTFSSSSSPSGFLKWYLSILETRPFITKSISSSLIFAVADVTSQVLLYSFL